ncbi:CAZyme family AA3 [Penicillium tannophilum]|nr:CAZyme family AA3 [Penicillium tannophilum]
MRSEYDVVVIGSGYGAAVAASRMARAGKSVAVLELGWERRSGSYAHSLPQVLMDFNVSGKSSKNPFLSNWVSLGNPTRLFQLFLGNGQHAFTAHGLGGCSLINAGVFLRADEDTLKMSPWPLEIRNDPSVLDDYYLRAEEMLQPATYPEEYPSLSKFEHLQEDSKRLETGENFYRAPLTIFFHSGHNNVGVPMYANMGSGHETTGLNDGSKNSVATTYLADAWNCGAEIFCGCEVRYVEKDVDGNGYIIHFAWHGSGRSVFSKYFKEHLFWVKATDFCFLGAGTMSTTEILLRSKKYGLQMSPLVGRNISGNGDMLLFGYNGKTDVNAIARRSSHAIKTPGPTITGVIDNRLVGPADSPLSGYIIQDGCIPEPMIPVIQMMFTLQTLRDQVKCYASNPLEGGRRTLAALKSLLFGPYARGGALQRTSTYLVMSHDSNEMTLTLDSDQLRLRAPSEGRSENSKKIKKLLNTLFGFTQASMGFSYFYGRHEEEVSVHPLGGANMSSDGTGQAGVTNHLGEVFTGKSSEVYKGLVCCDAAIIPTALGVNPLATITALSERSVELLAKHRGLSIDLETKNGVLHTYSKPRASRNAQNHSETTNIKSNPIGWQFTESLYGIFRIKSRKKDSGCSDEAGKGSSCAMQMFLTIDLCEPQKGSGYQGTCTGTVSCYALSAYTLKIVDGTVKFFTSIEEKAESSSISYQIQLLSLEGRQYYLEGHKAINSNMAFSVRKTWEATTTVNVSITGPDGARFGSGALHISLLDFQKQIRTFWPTQPLTVGLFWALIKFLLSFVLHVSFFFFSPFVPVRFPQPSTRENIRSKQRIPSKSCKIKTRDDVHVILEIYDPLPLEGEGTSEDRPTPLPILLVPGITGTAMHNLYALPFLRCNLIDYLTKHGYRCYALSPRWSADPSVAQRSTVFDCRLDVAAAVDFIRSRETLKPYVIAHCQGSVALSMGLLDGTISSSDLLGVTANSVFINMVFGYWNAVKGRTTLLIQLYETIAGSFFPVSSSARDAIFQRFLDALLRFYPVGDKRDRCTSTACHRTSFAFGLLWNHENLDMGIHDNIHQFFEGTHTKIMKQVVRMGARGECTDNASHSLLNDENLQRLQGLPILFISGTENQVFEPESTLKDYELLRRRFGERYYRRFLAEGYGHLDPIVGKNAAEDVYWRVLTHLRSCSEDGEAVGAK